MCHRASLLYAFAAIPLAKMAEVSQLPERVKLIATARVLSYFATAIVTYFIHGLLQDTENQLKPPFVLVKRELSGRLVATQMWMLAVAEIAGFVVLFYGVIIELVWAIISTRRNKWTAVHLGSANHRDASRSGLLALIRHNKSCSRY
jgi:hypothetical protein